jgi:hypothetical protein
MGEEGLQPHDDERASPSLADLRAQTTTITFPLKVLDGKPLTVTYKPMAFTGQLLVEMANLIDQFQAPGGATDEVMRGLCDCVADFVESWDLLGDDGSPMPITAENLMTLPWVFVNEVAGALGQEGRLNPTSGGASSALPRATRRAMSRTGSTSSKRRK